MLKFIVDFLTDGTTEKIKVAAGDIDNQEIATKFFLKNGFDLEDLEFKLLLEKPKYRYQTTRGLKAITKKNMIHLTIFVVKFF
jgi:hypothetical protein